MADNTDERLDRIATRLDSVDKTLRELWAYLQSFRSEAIERFDQIDMRIDLNYSTLSKRISHEQIAQGHTTQSLLERVSALEEQVAKLIKPAA